MARIVLRGSILRKILIVAASVLISACVQPPIALAQHGGGGPGGGGGHSSGGHGGGHSSHGSSLGRGTGKGAGHSIGHSIAHFFGWRGKNAGSKPPAASAALLDRKIIPQSNQNIIFSDTLRPVRHRPGEGFVFGQPFIFAHRRRFGFGGCPDFGYSPNSFFFGSGFDCFNSEYSFFDPYFFGLPSSSWYGSPAWSGNGPTGPSTAPMPGSPHPSESVDINSPNTSTGNETENNTKREPPMTLLQLRDGSMYGLTEYWVEGDKLHYFTTYGGENWVPIQRIDFEETVRLNADRGVDFVLRPKPATPLR